MYTSKDVNSCKNDQDTLQKIDWDAEYYKNNSQRQFEKAMKALEGYHFNGNERVLDVGCGDGKITAEIAQRLPFGNILGVDISPNMISESKKTFGDCANISFECADIVTYATEKKFDLVVSFSSFHWIKAQAMALSKIFSLLKPGGSLMIAMSKGFNPAVKATFLDPKWQNCVRRDAVFFPRSEDAMNKILEDAGFTGIKINESLEISTYKTKHELFDHVMGWVPYSTGLSNEQALDFGRDLVTRLCDKKDVVEYSSYGLLVQALRA